MWITYFASAVLSRPAPRLLQSPDDALQSCDEALPAVARAPVAGLVLGPEARLLHAHENAALHRSQGPRHHGLRSPRRLISRTAPRIGKPLVRFHDEDLAVGYAIPMRHGRGTKIEPVAHDGQKIVRHQPLLQQRALGERAPDFFRRMR